MSCLCSSVLASSQRTALVNRVVLVAGKFDPVHEGHLEHIIEASKLGGYLIVVTHRDEVVARVSKKGKCAVPLWARRAILRGLLMYFNIKGAVAISVDDDGTVAKTLEKHHPDIFAKGGDRKDDSCMPTNELEVCTRLGIQIVYGVGRLLNSSSEIEQ